ncbi:lipid droplet-associated protein [Gordonia caeni]|uniref:Lipid droplet-associated protein n=1 Tax=Gordonia caeni TaxID=1007097 RepID=A0ABP7PHH2_9ACTN
MTALDETKRLPTRVITLPMTAVSRGLQAGMRLQQNIAEMAIKGDEFFAPYCETDEEQPEWARFDDDEDNVISVPVAETTPTKAPAEPSKAAKPAKKAPARKAAARKPAENAPATNTPAENSAEVPTVDGDTPAAGSGRFALYSSPPADVASEPAEKAPAATSAGKPEVVGLLDYDTLTLAQLRAKLRGLSTDDLQALADYERAGRNRTPFTTMIDNRIASHQKKSGA